MQTIYAIPGLGTTKELFKNISILNYEIKVLDWPEPKKDYTLKDYSKQFLKQMDSSKPITLMGVSLGGMLCSELAEETQTNKIILISSCKDTSEFPFLLKALKFFPVHKLLPDKLVRFLAGTKRRFLGFEKSFDRIFFEMIQQMPKNYFRYCINYIINWDKIESQKEFIRIHGTADKLLPNEKGKNFHFIKGGSHVMILTKAKEINAILNKELNG